MHNVAEASKLTGAAGFKDGSWQASNYHGNSPKHAEILGQMCADAGIRFRIDAVDHNSVFLPKIWVVPPGTARGDFDGLSFGGTGGSPPHVSSAMQISHHSQGSFSFAKNWPDGGQKKLDDLINSSMREFDEAKLRNLAHDFQKEAALQMSGVPYHYGNRPFQMVWPWIQNFNAFKAHFDTAETIGVANLLNIWIDESRRRNLEEVSAEDVW